MRRREFITVLGGGFAAWTVGARAQQPSDSIAKVGMLIGIGDDTEGKIRVQTFQRRMQELGWIEGQNFRSEYRWAAGNPEKTKAYAAELVGLSPHVIVGASTPVTAALRALTKSIPIVFVVVSNPAGEGFVTNLARPEGNLTGFTNFEISMGGKWIEILKEMTPGTERVGIVFNPANDPSMRGYYSPSLDSAAHLFGVKLIDVPVRGAGEIDSAIEAFGREPNGGLVVLPDNTTVQHRRLVVASADKHRVPAIYPYQYFVTTGGLVSYGIDTVDLYWRAAAYVDRILRGAKIADLPVQQPTKFELTINFKTAKTLGITVPSNLRARVDKVIE
jgi:putative tryptophan/tyrosine transport system substrate-binding protein